MLFLIQLESRKPKQQLSMWGLDKAAYILTGLLPRRPPAHHPAARQSAHRRSSSSPLCSLAPVQHYTSGGPAARVGLAAARPRPAHL